jgi:hypothetical protein
VEDTHRWGITIEMLQDLADLVQSVLEKGYAIKDDPPTAAGEPVPFEKINLYRLDEHFVNQRLSVFPLRDSPQHQSKVQSHPSSLSASTGGKHR